MKASALVCQQQNLLGASTRRPPKLPPEAADASAAQRGFRGPRCAGSSRTANNCRENVPIAYPRSTSEFVEQACFVHRERRLRQGSNTPYMVW